MKTITITNTLSLLFLLLKPVQTQPMSPAPHECSNPARDSCSFYADCLESRYHCGPPGYPIGYGQKFCQKFSDDRAELSPRGQTWMLDTMHCLQDALVPEATGAVNTTCAAVEKKAFGTHARCYVDSGVCTLSPLDWLAIVDIVDVKTLFGSWDAFKATVQAGVGCLEFYAFLVQQEVGGKLEEGAGVMGMQRLR